MNIRLPALLALLIVALFGLALAGCGDDDDADSVIQLLVAEGASQEEAECFVDELGAEDAERFIRSEDGSEFDAEDLANILEALEACGIDE